MANEISVSVSLNVRSGNYRESAVESGRFDQAQQLTSAGVLAVGTNAVQTIPLGDVQTAGYAAFRNLSTATSGTSYIALGAYDGTTFSQFVHLRRGQPAVLPLKGDVGVGAQSFGTPGSLRYIILAE